MKNDIYNSEWYITQLHKHLNALSLALEEEKEEKDINLNYFYSTVHGYVTDLLEGGKIKSKSFLEISMFINKENMKFFHTEMKGQSGVEHLLKIAAICIIRASNIQKL